MEQTMTCFGTCVAEEGEGEAKTARWRDRQLSRMLARQHREDLKTLKLLLLGTAESGKSTITKQMRILHVNGFTLSEKKAKVEDIIRNIRESLMSIISALQNLNIPLERESNRASCQFLLNHKCNSTSQVSEEFWDHVERLWSDAGLQQCFSRSYEYQLMDSAKYFLDKVPEIRLPDYIPSDQDILRCRATTTSIQHTEFQVPEGGHHVKFSVYDVGGQRGERRKWIQVFDSVVAILYLADCSGYDHTLREDPSKNRLLESLEIFEQVWNNRFLRQISVLLFLNKIDILADKVVSGRTVQCCFLQTHPGLLPDYASFSPSDIDKADFMVAFPGGSDAPRRRGRYIPRDDVHPEVTKSACYIKHLFVKIVEGELTLKEFLAQNDKVWHQHHSCEYFYTCAVDTRGVGHVLAGCRKLIIQKHLERFGII